MKSKDIYNMEIRNQILINDIDGTDEMGINFNLYFDVRGASNTQRVQIREIARKHFKALADELSTIPD